MPFSIDSDVPIEYSEREPIGSRRPPSAEPPMSFLRRAANHPFLPAAAGILSLAFFFRPFLTSGFTWISGGPDDGRLCI